MDNNLEAYIAILDKYESDCKEAFEMQLPQEGREYTKQAYEEDLKWAEQKRKAIVDSTSISGQVVGALKRDIDKRTES